MKATSPAVDLLLAFGLLGPVPLSAQGSYVECVREVHALYGESPGDQFGWVSTPLTDLDGDGANEVAITAPFHATGGLNAGRVYVVSGRTGAQRFHADGGQAQERLGWSARDAGDVDGDGVGDVVFGGRGDSVTAGVARVYSGATGAEILTSTLGAPFEFFGASVTGIGDVDGDGLDDLAVGATLDDTAANNAGRVYLVSGSDGATVLWTIEGEAQGDQFGSAIANLGDVTMDGLPELAVGARNGGAGDRGKAYVYDVANRSLVYSVIPATSGTDFGLFFMASVGDATGDGVPDLYVSDFADGGSRGMAYVFDGPTGDLHWSRRGGVGDGFGIGRGVGDVDGDGKGDLILAGWTASQGAAGAGRAQIFSGIDGSLIRTITSKIAGENFGFDAHGVGDVDGDGELDFFVTAATNAGSTGATYLVAGGSQWDAFGQGLAGSGGFVPSLALSGCPRLGDDVTFEVRDVVGGAPGLLLIGGVLMNTPFLGGTLYVDTRAFRMAHVVGGGMGVAGAGTADLLVTVPSDPALAGREFYAQALYLDAGGPAVASATSGTRHPALRVGGRLHLARAAAFASVGPDSGKRFRPGAAARADRRPWAESGLVESCRGIPITRIRSQLHGEQRSSCDTTTTS